MTEHQGLDPVSAVANTQQIHALTSITRRALV
jgi:hypothetical protein